MIAGVVLVAFSALAPVRRDARIAMAGVGAAFAVGLVPAVLAAASIALVVGAIRIRRRSGTERRRDHDEAVAVDMVVLGLGGGLGFSQAVQFAAAGVGGRVRSDLERRLRTMHVAGAPARHAEHVDPSGSSGLLGSSDASDACDQPDPPGGLVAEAFAVARRSMAAGTPLQPALVTLTSAHRRDEAARERARIARLPVKLLFPLALLILPGFVLLAVAPVVVSGLSRLTL